MNIASKLTLGLVSVVFLGTVAFSSAVSAEESVADLKAQLNTLLAQLAALEGSSSTTTVGGSAGGNKACPHTWARNLTIGSTGKDVYQLQMFLNEISRLNNNNPKTLVAQSGAGSPGNESSYYGPATARAVSGFQEMYAAQILTPLGLSKGTGGFYTSTRNQANKVCATGSTTGPGGSGQVVSVSGGALAVTPGKQPADSYAVAGAQRVPFTSFVLTAGSKDVRLSGITVKRFGLSSSDNFESVALVDPNGVQIGSSRSLNRNNEAKLGGNIVIPKNRSVTLAVVGNIANAPDTGAVAGLEIVDVTADATIEGRFPIRGAAHVFSDGVSLQTVEVAVTGGGDSVEFNEDTEVADVRISLDADSDDDAEDAYLRSLTLEQTGSADEDEVGDIIVYVDDDRADHDITIDGDRYVITFDGKGALIEEDDSITLTLETNTDIGSGETIAFHLDDVSDVYVVGREYGYGLPVCIAGDKKGETECDGVRAVDDPATNDVNEGEDWKDTTDESEIASGTISRGSRIRDFDDEVSYGDDVVLGALSVEFEGEDIDISDLTFSATLSGHGGPQAWTDADEDEVVIENIQLRVDGDVVAYADDDVVFEKPADGVTADIAKNVEFGDSFTIDVRKDREVIFEIVADLDDAWGDFDGSRIAFTLTDVKEAEGVTSEKDYTEAGNFFAVDRDFEEVDLIGNEIKFEITDYGVDESSFVAGASDVVFGTLEIDASGTVDDIDLKNLEISFELEVPKPDSGTAEGTLSSIESCRVMDGSDEVADMRGGLSGTASIDSTSSDASDTAKSQIRLRFDRFTVEKDTEVNLDIVCDIEDGAKTGNKFTLKADTDADDLVDYSVGRDSREYKLTADDASEAITISASGAIDISVDNPDEDNVVFAVATGNSGARNIQVLEVEVEAEKEGAVIQEVWLSGVGLGAGGVAIDEDELEKVIDQIHFEIAGSKESARPRDFDASETFGTDKYNVASDQVHTNLIRFDRIGKTVEVDTEETFIIEVDLNGIDDRDGSAGQFLTAEKLVIIWEGEISESDKFNYTEIDLSSAFSTAVAHPTVPTVSATSRDQSLSAGSRKLYEFTVAADGGGDVYLNQVGLSVTKSATVTVTNLVIHRGTGKGGKKVAELSTVAAASKVPFTGGVEEIDAGESQTYSVYATVAGTLSDGYVTVEMLNDGKESSPALGRESAATATAGNFVWSPNALDNNGATSSNADWFTGWAVFDDSDVSGWTSSE